jgi:nicotinate-nucleotide adenylyltransferase
VVNALQAIGIFGGTFDPIHYGHLRLAEEMAEALNLREVRFIPAGQPPHRDTPRTQAQHRLEMLRLALADNARFSVDEREIGAVRPNYTVDTLTGLRGELGAQQPLCLLLGADAFLGLPSWHEWRRLFDLAHIVVAQRPGSRVTDAMPAPLRSETMARQAADISAAGPAGSVVLRAMTPLDISATAIREALTRKRSVRYLLPDAVLDYLQQHQLYKPQPA